jgi:hypothetical protein
MAKGRERRQSARITVPSGFSVPGRASQRIRLVELSAAGARMEHPHPLQAGVVCFVELPPRLGGGTFRGRIVWTAVHRDEQTPEGDRHRYYQSGLAWDGLTPEQLGALAAALEILTAAQEG